MTAITSIFQRYSTSQGAGNIYDRGKDLYESHVRPGARFTAGIGLTLIGSAIITSGSLFKTLAPDNTAADKWSLGSIIVGILTLIGGVVKLWNSRKQNANQPLPTQTFKLLTSGLDTNIGNVYGKLSNNSDPICKLSKSIVNGDPTANLRNDAINLFDQWTHNDFVNYLQSNTSPNPLVCLNGRGLNNELPISEHQLGLSALIGYITGSRTDQDLTNDPKSSEIINTKLKFEEAENGTSNLLRLLPEEFGFVYVAARYYKLNHMDTPNSFKAKFSRVIESDIQPKVTAQTGSQEKDDAWKYVEDFAKCQNYMKVLKQSIKYVLKVEQEAQSGKVEEKKIRDAQVLRNALVSGLELRVSGKEDALKKLEMILTGDARNKVADGLGTEQGIEAKIQESDKYLEQLQKFLRVKDVEVKFTDIFTASDAKVVEFEKT